MTENISRISIIGASGFVGRHLLTALMEMGGCELRALVHSKKMDNLGQQSTTFIDGDLLRPETLDPLFEPGCTVINLAYLASRSGQDNLEAMENLATACARRKVKRLIHCSTAVVAGRTKEDWINEDTPCDPASEYEKTKLGMERILLEKSLGVFEISILRPTAVFGPGGKNLLKLANGLNTGNLWVNYAKSCLFFHRNMNLVCVENVVAALIFLLNAGGEVDREAFIVSDDDSPINNYRDIERRLLEKFGRALPVESIALPLCILKALLYLSGKSAVNPSVKYSDRKLASSGFKKPCSLESGIASFANFYINHEHS